MKGQSKRLAIMQPYFFPYIGYFQLINAVDLFVIYDNIKYTKKGWINRNRIIQNGKETILTLPLKKASDYLDVDERSLVNDFNGTKLLNQIRTAYQRAPYFDRAFPIIGNILCNEERNLFQFLLQSIVTMCQYLEIHSKIEISSTIDINHSQRGQDRVLSICHNVRADTYINAIGGRELYSKSNFSEKGIELQFLQSAPFEYQQLGNDFAPWLSIVDVIMFNPVVEIKDYLDSGYELI